MWCRDLGLQLPESAVPDRVSIGGGTIPLPPGERRTFAELEGPGCIRHLWLTVGRQVGDGRDIVLRITFDDATVPQIEAPVGDFFGVMHGQTFYPLNTPWFSAQAESGLNCYLPMPFVQGVRIELEGGEQRHSVFMIVDWHRYPDVDSAERRHLCARWRREWPAPRRGSYLVLDADGPGQLLGFALGLRLFDNEDRWSHGGGDNIYIDGDGPHPAYLRGIGGEDCFGTSYGGALHPPETHLHAGLPYYVHEDIGEARPAQRVAGYRFFAADPIPFASGLQLRFGCMRNDLSSIAWWYQEGEVREFFRMPPASLRNAAAQTIDGPLPAGTCDLPLSDSGSWLVSGPGSEQWRVTEAWRGFVDFNCLFPAAGRGVGIHRAGTEARARTTLQAPAAGTASLRVAFDDQAVLSVNGREYDLGEHTAFRAATVEAPVRAGANEVELRLTNETGSNHGGWAFAFRAITAAGVVLKPTGSP